MTKRGWRKSASAARDRYAELARAACAGIADDEDRELVLSDLATIFGAAI